MIVGRWYCDIMEWYYAFVDLVKLSFLSDLLV